jgi:hypothetical protein
MALLSCSLLSAPSSIRPQRRRIIQQEIARTTHGVIRIGRLRYRRTRGEIVNVVARIEAATAARRGLATNAAAVAIATYSRVDRGRALVRALAFVTGHVAMRMAVPAAAPSASGVARRAIVRSRPVAGPAILSAIAAKQAAIRAHATTAATVLQGAAAANIVALAHWPRCVLRPLHVAWLVASLATRVATGVVIDAVRNMDGSASRGRKHRQHEHGKRAFHRFPPKDLGLAVARRMKRAPARPATFKVDTTGIGGIIGRIQQITRPADLGTLPAICYKLPPLAKSILTATPAHGCHWLRQRFVTTHMLNRCR